MSTRDTGGPAFPEIELDVGRDNEPFLWHRKGMTLRDYFAAKAMQGMLASLEKGDEPQVVHIPKLAYQFADMMLEARK